MTTENDPAGSAAATDETAPHSAPSDPTPVADPTPHRPPANEPIAADVADDQAAPASQQEPPSEAAADRSAAADESVSSAPTGPTPTSTTLASSVERASAPSGQSAADAPPATSETPPLRRIRLNPTVAPDVAKPIPSLRPTEPPPPATPPATPPPSSSTSAEVTPSQPVPPLQTAVDVSEVPQASEDAAAPQDAAAADPAEGTTAPPPPPVEPVALPGKNESLDADLEAELEAAMIGSEQQAAPAVDAVAALAEAAEAPLTPEMEVKRGTKLTGTVASIHGDDMFLDFGLRVPGVLSRRQFGLRKQPMQGETLEVVVGRVDENEGLMHVNLPTGTSKVRGEWDALSVDQNVECLVTGTNKGGLEVSIGMLRGFMPASQVELGYVPDLNVYIGQKINARISEVNPKRRKLVLSRRALLEEEREQSQQELFEKIEPGQQYTGRVRTLKDYGAFVDIGGADGLLHVAQISWSRIKHPSEVLTEGEEIEVQVLSIDKEKKKISLGMRQLTQNPWKAAQSKYAQGAVVQGKVTRIENFGAFVELEDGVEGLVHISELDHKRINKVTEVLRVGQEIEVQVLEVDPKKKRISLSLKALKEKPEDPREAAESAPVKRQRSVDTLVGGMGKPTGGQLFGDPNKFGG